MAEMVEWSAEQVSEITVASYPNDECSAPALFL
jgi:hypothetical protein